MKAINLKVGDIIAVSQNSGQTFDDFEVVIDVIENLPTKYQARFMSTGSNSITSPGDISIKLGENNRIMNYSSGGYYYLVSR